MRFKDMVVLVTGGAQGIGMNTTYAFGKEGAKVYFIDVDEEAGREHLEYLLKEGIPAVFYEADVSNEKDVREIIEDIVAKEGVIDILVNNAAIIDRKSILDRSVKEWERIISVNLTGPYICSRYTIPHMNEGGSIVNISSTRALMSEKNTEPYSASKGGIKALTHSLAVSLSEKKIRVNCISPGWIDVSSWKKKDEREQEELTEQDHKQHPVNRVGIPKDISEGIMYLCDNEKAGFITGQNITIDGGMTVKMIYEE
ncbi:SDR family oxidoreductase [Clostridium sp. D2Q-11]|uniref:SDR family oxidoreductase n=1 Tax=Anaeromonas frigoriresistens TaxID=2683708 RepID=A0A942UWD0_9FIRM|nr:SDR family oxidoreductase [Anaeromonas frigoriresistens]MBS4537616.1 SDR family oxidoreductase [Anaeromonas frigoriresistens]